VVTTSVRLSSASPNGKVVFGRSNRHHEDRPDSYVSERLVDVTYFSAGLRSVSWLNRDTHRKSPTSSR
jgi:hypothetical protein